MEMKSRFLFSFPALVLLFVLILLLEQHGSTAARQDAERSSTNTKSIRKLAKVKSNTFVLKAGFDSSPDSLSDDIPKRKRGNGKGAKTQPPNVIMIIADDLGYNDVGYHGKFGRSVIETPNIDELAYNGVRLENYYVQPVCTPTRSQLLTGRYQIHTGMQHLNLFPGRPVCMPTDEFTLAQALRKLGYSTHAVGKWHLGYAWKDCLPTRRGFDSFFGNIMGSSDHWSHNKSSMFDEERPIQGKSMYLNEKIYWKNEGTFSTYLYTARAKQIMRKQLKKKPLFLYLSYEAVHSPLSVPKQYVDPYADSIVNGRRRKYAGMVNILDEAVKNVTEALKMYGLYDNSVIIFTTDNGGRTRPKSAGNNWPLRGGKNTMWEGGIRGVGFVHSPLIPYETRGLSNHGLIHVSDWFPTIVKGIAGGRIISPKPLDGVNQWKTILKGTESKRKEILHNIDTYYPPAVWTSEMVRNYGRLEDLPFNATWRAAIRLGNWKLLTGLPHEDYWEPPRESGLPTEKNSIRWTPPVRLYNVRRDPYERQNLAPYYKKVVYRLLKRLQDHQNTAVKPLHLGEKDPRGNPRLHGGAWVPWMDNP